MSRLSVIGIGYRPLDQKGRQTLLDARAVFTSQRLALVFSRYDEYGAVKDRMQVINSVDETMHAIRQCLTENDSSADSGADLRPVVLLASGDPLFFGIGRRAVLEFGRENIDILPDLSSIQLAFSRIGIPWDDALLISLHGGPDPGKRRRLKYDLEDLPLLVRTHNKICMLTDREKSPTTIASFLHASDIRHRLLIHVCEKLGYAEEKITRGTPEEIAGLSFSDPNVVIVMKDDTAADKSIPDGSPLFGLSEEAISHSRGLITKDEVRAVAIHKLKLFSGSTVWDIGAGSGSVSLEIARVCPGSEVYAVEKDAGQLAHIRQNKTTFEAANITIVDGAAPDILNRLPMPQRVFIGGSNGRLSEIITFIDKCMDSGIVVITATMLDTLHEGITCLEQAGFLVSVSEVTVSRSRPVAGRLHMSGLNPIFIISGEKNI
ncbi:MAG: precorrin-6y C5,15-methyltransferase (decarboxylating) subunit CbiE [Nitrospiraceae bacterium]|nr:precorrin-6y C5,15-methyltransferase (decarboxylating) subunit CbiE [Nitrospiraceae bacterium]